MPAYYLGDSDRELDRLRAQARVIDPITKRFFRDAGIIAGMRVLDVGSGAGDVAFLVADLVGDLGEVVGVDRAPNALARATARADAQSRRNVFFRQGDPAQRRSTGRSTLSSDATYCSFSPIPRRCSESWQFT
jgi:SAM-dependent methyltransferase